MEALKMKCLLFAGKREEGRGIDLLYRWRIVQSSIKMRGKGQVGGIGDIPEKGDGAADRAGLSGDRERVGKLPAFECWFSISGGDGGDVEEVGGRWGCEEESHL